MTLTLPVLALCLLAAGCGQKGGLYLPEETTGTVVTRPGPAAAEDEPEEDAPPAVEEREEPPQEQP